MYYYVDNESFDKQDFKDLVADAVHHDVSNNVDEYNDFLDSAYHFIEIGNKTFFSSEILYALDQRIYDSKFDDYVDHIIRGHLRYLEKDYEDNFDIDGKEFVITKEPIETNEVNLYEDDEDE